MTFKMADEQEELPENHEVNMDYQKMKQTHELAGYREGIESGKEAHLQQGFNQGFSYAAYVSRKWATLRGALSALMSLVMSKYVQDSNPGIVSEITELLAEATQIERNALEVQNMQHTLENRMNQTFGYFKGSAIHNESNSFGRPSKGNKTDEQQVDGNELSSAIEMLHTADIANGAENLEVESDRVQQRIYGGITFQDIAMDVVSDESCRPLEANETLPKDLEMLWSRTYSLADKIGINRQKIIFLKCL